MFYLYIKHIDIPEFELYIEVGDDGWATRQIIVEGDKVEISCLDDCLAQMNLFEHLQEEILDRGRLENEEIFTHDEIMKHTKVLESKGTVFITLYEFESKWSRCLVKRFGGWTECSPDWIGSTLHCEVTRINPKWAIAKFTHGDGFGIIKGEHNLKVGEVVHCEVVNFDYENMWYELVLSEAVFSVEMYMKYGEKPKLVGHLENEFLDILSRNNIKPQEGQMVLWGWADRDFELKEVLITKNKAKIYVERFMLFYGKEIDIFGHGMRGGFVCNVVDEEFRHNERIERFIQ